MDGSSLFAGLQVCSASTHTRTGKQGIFVLLTGTAMASTLQNIILAGKQHPATSALSFVHYADFVAAIS